MHEDHEHAHGECSCAHGHEHTHGGCACEQAGELHIEKMSRAEVWKEHGPKIRLIAIGAAIFAAALFLEKGANLPVPSRVLYLIAYVLLGIDIYKEAFAHIRRGQIFDENLLMILASIGAIAIGEYPEAVAVLTFYRIGELFEDIAVDHSRAQISEVLDLRPEIVSRVKDGVLTEVPAEEIAIGDHIQIRPGDRIPLDGVVVDGESRVDTSPMTGEPMPVAVRPGSEILSGCLNQSGVLEVEVTQPLSESMVSRVLRSVEEATENKPHMERFISRFARVYTPAVVVVALLVFLIPVVRGGDWHYWLRAACTFLVISCPCALVISVPLSFVTGIAAASKRGILFKSGEALEMIDRIRYVVLDKTGTLTNGVFGLQRVVAEGAEPDEPIVPGEDDDYEDEYEDDEDEDESESEQERILRLCASAEETSSHPLAQSILRAAKAWDLEPEKATSIEEIAGHGIRAVVSEGTVLCGSRTFLKEEGVAVPDGYLRAYGAEVYVALNGEYLGRLLLADKIRADAESFLRAVRHIGAEVAILTGDKEANARAVANHLGIKEVHAELLPDEKLEVLRKIRKKRGCAFYIGDGINDAPVMAGADISGAMAAGADIAVETADIVYMNSDLKAVEESIDIGFQTKRIAAENIVLSLVIKLGVIFLGLVGYANMWMAIVADTGVLIICVINAVRVLYVGKYRTTRKPREYKPEEGRA